MTWNGDRDIVFTEK